MKNVCCVVLAAGDGKRMKSAYPKVLCPVLFRPMITWVTNTVAKAGIGNCCAVLGAGADMVRQVLPQGCHTVLQNERRGTGHAAMMAAEYIKKGGYSHVALLYGDAPFVAPEDITAAYEQHIRQGNAVTILAARLADPTGYGRVIREGDSVKAVVEQADADEETRLIGEINSGTYWFEAGFLLEFFDNMTCHNAQGEYYLTDTVEYAAKTKRRAGACVVGADVALGANDQKTLASLNRMACERVLERHYRNGVHIPLSDGIIIADTVEIGPDTIILPGTILRGNTKIGSGCEVGPGSCLQDTIVGDNCKVISTYMESAVLEDNIKIGPMCHVRPNSHIASGAKIGNFVEIKNSQVGEGTSVAHLTYVGDSDVGRGCNFGCGVVTVNYDGSKKHRTVIGDDVFIGCNTNLVAPVQMGDRSYSAAGTTVTEDVPADALVIGRARQTVKENWSQKTGKFAKKK